MHFGNSIHSPNETTKINFQFLCFISICYSYTKYGECVANCTYFAFSTIKMSAQEYVSKVSGQSA